MKKAITLLAAQAYNSLAMQFLMLLLVIIFIAGGLPLYGDDLLHVQVVNDEHSQRGIFIQDRKVMIVEDLACVFISQISKGGIVTYTAVV